MDHDDPTGLILGIPGTPSSRAVGMLAGVELDAPGHRPVAVLSLLVRRLPTAVFRTVRWLASAPDVDTKDALELATVDDQDPVEALAPDRADEALGVGVRLLRLDRRLDDFDPFAEDLIKRAVELRVAIANQESKRRARSASDQASWRACCAAQAPLGFWVQPSRCTRSLPSSMKNRTYSLVERTVSRVKKSHAIRLAA